jgi:DNA topoisomerase-3
MAEIAAMTEHIVARAKTYGSDTVPIEDPAHLATPCPRCGHEVVENYRRYACTHCEFSLPKHPAGRTFEVEEVETLIRDRALGPMQGFISKMGRPFAAALKLVPPEFKLEFDFGQDPGGEGEDGEAVDFSGQDPVGPCPKCAGRIYEQPMAYVCEHSVGANRTCDFRSGKVILQQPIERAQMQRLLGSEGRTELLRGFVSNRTRRKFSAFLTRGKDGKVVFEFEPRPARAPRAAAGSADEAAEAAAKPAAKKAAAKTATRAASAPAKSLGAAAKKSPAKKAAKTAAKKAAKAPARKTARKTEA